MYHSDYVHLHVHSQYSLLDGACRVKELVQKAAEYKMPALGLTDHGNMFGAIDFYQSAVKVGVKPIIGCEAYVAPGSRTDRSPQQGGASHLVLFAKDETGYKNLMKLVSAGYLEGFYYRPRMDKEILAKHSEGLLCTSACLRGEVAWFLRQNDYASAMRVADEYHHIFGKGNFYLELMEHGIPDQKVVNEGLIRLSKDMNLPLVVTNDVHYLQQDQSKAHEALLCIQTQSLLNDPNRMRLKTDQFYFKDPALMKKEFSWVPDALKNTLEIAEKCNLTLDFNQYHLPNYEPPGKQSRDEFLEDLCRKGMVQRFGQSTMELEERLKREMAVIKKMGFVSYFLIVWDFIHYARQRGIPVGPGRGSAAGSLVSYLLGITNLDPLKYGLLFERFLNPDRLGMPDIDIDFCFERRGEVIEYVTKKYGKENVAQIITFGTMQARAAVRDVGRVMGAPYSDVDKIAKLIPAEPGKTLKDALKIEPQLDKLCKEDKVAAEIIETAQVLEGLNRHASIHAAGVVIADKPLTEYVPLFKSSDDQITTGFSMDGIAKIGLLKMDFLGLRTLTVIDKAVKWIKRRRNIDINIETIPLDDKKTFELLSQATSAGIFQLESAGMRELLKKIKPNVFEDLISILALYRPGPMGSGMLDDFIKRKRGEVNVQYPHPKLEGVLKETYGIIVYQEQVMQMASVMAGFSMVQADHLRRAMSKKIPDVMDKMRHDFVEGCWKNSHTKEDQANKLFDLIDYFSGYGFNRSHSAAYALISYQTAFLKANYPVEFMCALLTSEKDNTDKVVEYVRECEAIGITILPPDVNESVLEFSVVDDKTIRFGLLAVKNVGRTGIESIVENRTQSGHYKSLSDLCNRVDLRLVNRKVLESLVKSGAMDSFGGHRAQLTAMIDRALDRGTQAQREKAVGQFSFFDMGGGDEGFAGKEETLPDIKEWRPNETLAFEKEVLGFYVSGHPLSHYQVEIKEFSDFATKDLRQATEGKEIKIVGIIDAVKLTTTRKGNERMAIVTLEDLDGTVEIVIFPSTYPNVATLLVEGSVVVVVGRVNFREDRPGIVASDIRKIEDVYKTVKAINVDLSGVNAQGLGRLKEKLAGYPGKIPVYLRMDTKNYKSVQIMVGEDLFVAPSELLMNDIKELVGKEKFSVTL
ncbi:MAG: DNA polymerase III subunit alpha [Candidatus Omnitrophota bacterium]|nr:DNA polymerase III subunit alpha [Candidatus Omnitrophota bacterium]